MIRAFPEGGISNLRKSMSFVNRSIKVREEQGEDADLHPCIVLVEKETNIPVAYTGFEKFIRTLNKAYGLRGSYVTKMAVEVCGFLNYMLHETNYNSVNEFTIDDIRQYMYYAKKKTNGEEYKADTWRRRIEFVFNFLENYYNAYKNHVQFRYQGGDLQELVEYTDHYNRKRIRKRNNTNLNVKPPRTKHRKNRVLAYGYLDLILSEARKHDPMIALAIAMQAYAGLREGEVTNLTCGSVGIKRQNHDVLMGIELDIMNKAEFWRGISYKSPTASLKKNQHRKQKVYTDFLGAVHQMYEDHINMLESKGYSIGKGEPLLRNCYGKPMTVQLYSLRVKKLFYDRFLPMLKKTCEVQGTLAENMAFIETYEGEYPGAHMFRHWFTMYLLTKTNLKRAQIQKYRNDMNPETMQTYIHDNADWLELFKNSAYYFQEMMLREIESV